MVSLVSSDTLISTIKYIIIIKIDKMLLKIDKLLLNLDYDVM